MVAGTHINLYSCFSAVCTSTVGRIYGHGAYNTEINNVDIVLVTTDPQSVQVSPPMVLEGKLAENDFLTFGERLYEGVVGGPESFVVDGDHIYTSSNDGYIYDLHNGTGVNFISGLPFVSQCLGNLNWRLLILDCSKILYFT